jgi:hypothetical protein
MPQSTSSEGEKAGLALHHKGGVEADGIFEYLVGSFPIQVAIHYANTPSFDPGDERYDSNGQTALKYLVQFGENHTPVCAHYKHLDGEAYVGRLSDDFTVLVAQGGQVIDEIEATPRERVPTEYDQEEVTFLKAVAIENPVKVTEDEHPILFESGRWNAGKAFHPWDSKRGVLDRVIDGRDGDLTAEMLPWPLAEKLSEEYLRRELNPNFAKQADGRSGRETIDLIGFDANKQPVVTQTTTATSNGRVHSKAEALRDYVETEEDRYGYLFALEATEPEFIQSHPDLAFISLEEILTYSHDHPSISCLLH